MSVLIVEIVDLRSGSHRCGGTFDSGELELGEQSELKFEGKMQLDIRLNTTDQLIFFAHGELSYQARTECRRCLKRINLKRSAEVRGVYAFPEGLDKLDLSEEERELQGITPLASDQKRIELTGLVRETVILDYPRFELCSEDCKGYCPSCGADLNEKVCDCESHVPDSRWSELLDLKKKLDRK